MEHYEVCSPGEFHICVQNGLDMEKIVLSGVNKEYGDVRYAMEQGVIRYTAESRHQFELVHQCAAELQKTVEILLRVTSGNQFGMSEEDVVHLIQHKEEYPHLDVVGVQYFSGTQKKISGRSRQNWNISRILSAVFPVTKVFRCGSWSLARGLGCRILQRMISRKTRNFWKHLDSFFRKKGPMSWSLRWGVF